ncbi:MAG: ATP-binding cassette domain-containing protein [Chloracidobacterium sp.]|uniref:ATP-binding cassette domain-containing protein n=1 Tax=Chloracidobacterium validum TaxID=2821543 RepID=A0ABX8BE51_9BACT|nr:ATP-binding cassette domain-containing protein [Chloracidobacterium validum]QUW03345.1 ATP-binding cassette domain-containing protein [Chloracidobacterium validum]
MGDSGGHGVTAAFSAADSDHAHPTPTQRLWRLLVLDSRDMLAILAYTTVAGLFSLAVPITAQVLVNTIAQGQALQQLVVLAALVLFFLSFAGVLRLFQLVLLERLQQRIFVRVSMNLGDRLPRLQLGALTGEYAPELVNRFFDVINIQKAFAKLALDGLDAVLKVFVGLLLLAFYSPILLGFDLAVVFAGLFIIFVLGINGLRTSILESKKKYKVAAWLEELARCHISFKMSGTLDFITEQTNALSVAYLKARRSHFAVLFRQAVGNYFFYALASAGILAIGGWLVINRQLTIGQLVAAEIVVVSVLAGLDKVISQLEHVYDLLTALDKVGHVEDLPIERKGGIEVPDRENGASVVCRNVRFSYRPGTEVLSGVDLSVGTGEWVSVVGLSGAGKSTLMALICGLLEPSHGTVEVNGVDVRDANLDTLRLLVGMVGDREEIFEGTIEENLRVGADWLTQEDIRWAIDLMQLTNELAELPQGLQTPLVSGGYNLSRGQVQRLLLARTIARRPKLLILDEAFMGIDECAKLKILDAIYDRAHRWTIIDISHDSEVVVRSSTIHVLDKGMIIETGSPEELSWRRGGAFASLFPEVSRQLIGKRLPTGRS